MYGADLKTKTASIGVASATSSIAYGGRVKRAGCRTKESRRVLEIMESGSRRRNM